MKKLIFCHPRRILSLLLLPIVAFCLTANVAKGQSECYTPDGPGNGFAPSVYIPERLTPSFRFGLTPLFRTFDPQNVNNIPEV